MRIWPLFATDALVIGSLALIMAKPVSQKVPFRVISSNRNETLVEPFVVPALQFRQLQGVQPAKGLIYCEIVMYEKEHSDHVDKVLRLVCEEGHTTLEFDGINLDPNRGR